MNDSADNLPEETKAEVKPSYAPAGMAMGIIMLMWGFLTYWIMSAVGALLIAACLAMWMQQIRENQQ